MFEPENEIERLLVRAAADPFARAAFTRALMDAQIFLVLVPDGPVEPQPDGSVTIPEGTKLNLPSATRGEVKLLPFFTSAQRARTWFNSEHLVVPDKTRDAAIPNAKPRAASPSVRSTIRRCRSAADAPSAIRIPISCTR